MKDLIKAIAKAKTNFGPITKSAKATAKGGKEYRYATLDDIMHAISPALSAESLHVYHTYLVTERFLEVTAHVTDGDHELTSMVPMPLAGVSENSNVSQAMGSLLTYGRRYSTSALFSICVDEDDDAQSTEKENSPKAAAQEKPPRQPGPVIQPAVKNSFPHETNVLRQQQLEWLARKFDEYGLPQKDRERILAEAEGKTMAQIIAEIESCACTEAASNAR